MQHSLYYFPLNASKESNLYILFAITVAGVVPCGGPEKSPLTSPIVQIYLCSLRSEWSDRDFFRVSQGPK